MSGKSRPRSPDDEVTTTNTAALTLTLEALLELGRINQIDLAQVQTMKSLAHYLDVECEECGATRGDAAMWRQYREALSDFLGDDNQSDSVIETALKAFNSATPVGDATST